MPGFGIDLRVADMHRKARQPALGVERSLGRNRPAGHPGLRRDLGQRQAFAGMVARGAVRRAIAPFYGFAAPDQRRALGQFGHHTLRRRDYRATGGESGAAPAGDHRKADRGGIGDRHADLFIRQAQRFGRHDRHAGAAAADVGAALGHQDRTIAGHADLRGRRPAKVHPQPARDAATLPCGQRRGPVGMGLGRLKALDIADIAVGQPEQARIAGLHRVYQPHLERIKPKLLRQFVDAAFHRERRLRRARRAIGRGRGHVAQHVPPGDVGIGHPVMAQRHRRAVNHVAARERSAVEPELDHRASQRAIGMGAQLDVDDRSGRRPAGAEHLVPGHRQPHRPPGLARQQHGHRFEIDLGLAAEPAADFQRGDADIGLRDLQDRGGQFADHEVALAGCPDLRLSVTVPHCHAGMRLDIALMYRRGDKAPLDHHRRAGQRRGRIAAVLHMAYRRVGLGGCRCATLRHQSFVQDRCAG